jgi:hypothetical protein
MSDIVTSQVFTDGEKGITATKMNNIISQSVIQPDFVLNKPTSSTLDPTDQLLELKSTNAYARITGSQLISSVSSQVDVTSQITAVRLRSFNAVGNSSMECDQKLCGSVSGTNGLGIDRWNVWTTGTMAVNRQQLSPAGNVVNIPGTNYSITSKLFRTTLTTAQATLGASDNLIIIQTIEGSALRELYSDVHSLSILCQSSVANLNFSLTLLAPDNSATLVKLCTMPVSGWTIIKVPNLPGFSSSGGNFSVLPGNAGYVLMVCLAAGSSLIAPSAGVWNLAKYYGASGMSNFAGQAVNSTFDIAFIQHEPGAQCTTLIDKPFSQNLDECLRYYQKTYDYGVKPGTVSGNGSIGSNGVASIYMPMPGRFNKPMAKVPTVQLYSPSTGAAAYIRDSDGGADAAVGAGAVNLGVSGFAAVGMGGNTIANHLYLAAYTADTGW